MALALVFPPHPFPSTTPPATNQAINNPHIKTLEMSRNIEGHYPSFHMQK
jgi:hypothetical protein